MFAEGKKRQRREKAENGKFTKMRDLTDVFQKKNRKPRFRTEDGAEGVANAVALLAGGGGRQKGLRENEK